MNHISFLRNQSNFLSSFFIQSKIALVFNMLCVNDSLSGVYRVCRQRQTILCSQGEVVAKYISQKNTWKTGCTKHDLLNSPQLRWDGSCWFPSSLSLFSWSSVEVCQIPYLHGDYHVLIFFKTFLFKSCIYYLFLGCARSLLLCGLFFSGCERELFSSCGAPASHCGGFSCGAQALGHVGFSSCGFWALEHRLSSRGAWAHLLWGMWDLPRPTIKSVSPALTGGFFTTEHDEDAWCKPLSCGFCPSFYWYRASLVAQLVKNPPAIRETWVHSLG